MIEHKVDFVVLHMTDIEMDIYLYFQSTFEYIFHKINVVTMNMNVVSIKDIDILDKNIHEEEDDHLQSYLDQYFLLLLLLPLLMTL